MPEVLIVDVADFNTLVDNRAIRLAQHERPLLIGLHHLRRDGRALAVEDACVCGNQRDAVLCLLSADCFVVDTVNPTPGEQ